MSGIFRYSGKDVFPALCGLIQLGVVVSSIYLFLVLPRWTLPFLYIALILGFCWNLHGIAHVFIHNPYFKSSWLNRAYSLVLSIDLGVPQTLHEIQHWNHHRGDNDAIGPDGSTVDWVSTYRHGKNGEEENLLPYALLGPLRLDLPALGAAVIHKGRGALGQASLELAVLLGVAAALLLWDWQYLVLFYLPCYYAGWALIYAENYALHHGAKPGNRYANAVSSYHRLTNWLFFNNGFHQEHHAEPKAHWTEMPEVRRRLAPKMAENETEILVGPHLTMFFEHWLIRRRRTAKVVLQSGH